MKNSIWKIRQADSFPLSRSRFFTSFFATLITFSLNIARERRGFIYLLCKKIYLCVIGYLGCEGEILEVITNIGRIAAQLIDVAISVVLLYYCLDFIIRYIQNNIYSKISGKRRAFLRELVYENIIPTISEIGLREQEFICQNDLSCECKNSQAKVQLSKLASLHLDIIHAMESEGILETITKGQPLSKKYKKYLEYIRFPLLATIFCEEKRIVESVYKRIEEKYQSDASYKNLQVYYQDVLSGYRELANKIQDHLCHEDLSFLFETRSK